MTKPILEPGIKGVVTSNDWIMCPDGDTSKYIYGALEVFSEGDLLGFVPKQDAGWYIVVNRKVLIPGCQVRGIYLSNAKPAGRQVVEP
jgi:hypothetical protein